MTDAPLQRMRITIEYDGSGLVGWQRQDNGPSVQQYLEEAALRLTGRATLVQGSGRTDAGVHATGQVAHLDVPAHLDSKAVMMGLNSWLETPAISVCHAAPVAADFHARFDAIERRYLYRIYCHPARPALDRGRVWHIRKPLDVKAMREAANYLVGRHDFTSFRATACQAESPVRTLDRLDVISENGEIHIRAVARSFLHHQIRNITGSLAEVGLGKQKPRWMKTVLEARDRTKAGQTAPASGLYLSDICYPGDARD
ncbi:MAG: tRNA pseudouridine(38-40) synthase TruA [Candidatus Puniceispirillaceae bacterium]